ncbi:BAR adaptor protein Hob1 [Coemansia sp. RSA 1200]|nr:BAR adaptor protein Hob1 [Coemansia sp. RSA 1200]
MSWKGFKKALERMPHQIQSKISRTVTTVDSDYEDLKVQFVEMEKSTKDLFRHAAEFRDSIRNMLIYQSAYLEQVLAVYKPISTDPESISQPVGSYVDEGASQELLRVAEEFQRRMAAIKANVEPQLARMDISVVGPIQEMLAMMRNVHKVMDKRDHKLIDYDRYRVAIEKAEAKEGSEGQRRLPEERAFQKNGVQYQEASRQYNYYNDMLKAQLKQLLDMRQAFIDPIFLKFFRMQHTLYTSLFREFSDAARNCPAFDLGTPVLVGWQRKWGLAEQHLSKLDLWGHGYMEVTPLTIEDQNKSKFGSVMNTFRKKDKPAGTTQASSVFKNNSPGINASPLPPPQQQQQQQPPPVGSTNPYGSAGSNNPYGSAGSTNPYGSAGPSSAQNRSAQSPSVGAGGALPGADTKNPYGTYNQQPTSQQQQQQFPMPYQGASQTKPPVSGEPGSSATAAPPSYHASAGAPSGPPKPLSPRPPEKGGPAVQYVTAIYDYAGQADGDLVFKEGDRIQLVERTESKDNWWTGRLNGVEGIFPGTYVTDPE